MALERLEPYDGKVSRRVLRGIDPSNAVDLLDRCEKKLHWVHVASSQVAMLYTIHAKRCQEAMDAADILPKFKGIGVHDHWFPYF